MDLLRPIADGVFDLVSGIGGTVSGEHGDGRLRSAYLRRAYPNIYDLFVRVKTLLDPNRLFNPEIKTARRPRTRCPAACASAPGIKPRFGGDAQLRWVRGSVEETEKTAQLRWGPGVCRGRVERCHGCSKCTTITTATRMCPVYKFTRDESAAPKAKANVLRALISGAVASRTLYEREFQNVMAQCVNCGSCYAECPSNVNIPKLAMEAKARYVKRFGTSLADGLTAPRGNRRPPCCTKPRPDRSSDAVPALAAAGRARGRTGAPARDDPLQPVFIV